VVSSRHGPSLGYPHGSLGRRRQGPGPKRPMQHTPGGRGAQMQPRAGEHIGNPPPSHRRQRSLELVHERRNEFGKAVDRHRRLEQGFRPLGIAASKPQPNRFRHDQKAPGRLAPLGQRRAAKQTPRKAKCASDRSPPTGGSDVSRGPAPFGAPWREAGGRVGGPSLSAMARSGRETL
jgi:hypothetical protein